MAACGTLLLPIIGMKAAVSDTVTSSGHFDVLQVAPGAGVGGEAVLVFGRLHAMAHVTFNGDGSTQIDVETNLVRVDGIGFTTGFRYRATGSHFHRFLQQGPPIQPPYAAAYRLFITGPPIIPGNPVFPLALTHSFEFDAAGHLLGGGGGG